MVSTQGTQNDGKEWKWLTTNKNNYGSTTNIKYYVTILVVIDLLI